MQTVTVIATKDFIADDGTDVHAGEAVTVSPVEAAVRGHSQEVSLDPAARATYRTRDMNATTVQAPPAEPISETPQKTTRRRGRPRKVFTS